MLFAGGIAYLFMSIVANPNRESYRKFDSQLKCVSVSDQFGPPLLASVARVGPWLGRKVAGHFAPGGGVGLVQSYPKLTPCTTTTEVNVTMNNVHHKYYHIGTAYHHKDDNYYGAIMITHSLARMIIYNRRYLHIRPNYYMLLSE